MSQMSKQDALNSNGGQSFRSETEYEGGSARKPNNKGKNGEKPQGGSFLSNILTCGKYRGTQAGSDSAKVDFNNMSEAEKKQRIQQLWSRARRYNNKLRFQARL